METEYYTTVTAPEAFWERLVSEKLVSGFPTVFRGEEAGFTMKSKYGPAIWDIIALSYEYPDERFTVVVTTNNKYKDVIEYYEFQSGATFFNHLEPLYHFDVSEEVNREAGLKNIDEFKAEIKEILDKINVFVPSYEQVICCENPSQEIVSNIQFEYGCQDLILTARIIGHTYIEIDLESEKNNCIKNLKLCH